jgi:xanthine dehydrogenase molybdenum-binding subunit
MKSPQGNEYAVIGTRPPRIDAADKATGRARFGTDTDLPRLLHGKMLRSPHAHARILAIDTHRATAYPGVYAVVTAEDLPAAAYLAAEAGEGDTGLQHRCDNTLARDKVLYVGHPIAAVAASDPHTAEQAARLIDVEYELLPAVMDVLDAMREDAPLLHENMRTRSLAGTSETPSNVSSYSQNLKGDPERGFAEADVVVEREFRTAPVHQGYLEPHATTATWGPDGMLTVYTTTQGAFTFRDHLASLLCYPMSKIRVVPTEVGGAFGGKNTSYLDAVAALLSRKAGRPVKMVMTRAETLLATGPSSGTVIRLKMGAKKDGGLTAAHAQLVFEAGAYPGSPIWGARGVIFAAYDIPHARIDGYDVVVNKTKTDAYRAPGTTPAVFAVEQVIDELAVKTGIDPLEFRLLNRAREGTRRISGALHTAVGSHEVLEAAQAHPHYSAPLAGPYRGRGMAYSFWGCGGGQSSCTLDVNADGTVSLVTGSVDITGTRTSMAMQVAETLGLPLDQVRSSVGDTDSVGYTGESAGSRTTMATGVAVVTAAKDVIEQMCERAATLWDVPADTVSYREGRFITEQEGSLPLTFAELAAHLPQTGGAVTGVGNVNVRGVGGSFGAHIVDVEVDPETGQVTVSRYTAVQDAGRAVHPAQVEGQMQGGVVQGIGWALYEGYAYDEGGEMLNPSLLDYKLPTALDVPSIETVIVEVPYPNHPYGVRGAGETPIQPPPAAIANAIYRATGARLYELPMTPARILQSMGVI